MEKEIISARQFTIITFLFTIGTAILIIPASIASDVKQDAWIVATIGVVLSLLLITLYVTLANRTPNQSFVESNEKILGKFIGKLTSVGFFLLTFTSACELVYFVGTFMTTEVMPETPISAFTILFSIIILMGMYLGIEVFARSAEILFPIFIFIFIIFVICISPQIDVRNIQPVFEANKLSMLSSIISFMSIFSFPLIVLLMIFPSAVNISKNAQKGFYLGTVLGGLVLIITISLTILVLGAESTSSTTFPSYAMAQKISIGNFIERIEVIMAIIWIISIYIKSFMYFYASMLGLTQILNIKDYRPLLLPMGMNLVAFAQIAHPNIVHANLYNKETWPLFSSIFAIFLPILLIIVAKIRKISGKEENNQNMPLQPSTNNDNKNTEQNKEQSQNDL